MAWARCDELALPRIVSRSFHGQEFFPVRPIAILNSQRNRRTDGLSVAHSRKNFRSVLFDLLPSAAPIPKLPAQHLVIDEVHVHRQSRAQTRDNYQQVLPG